jgi:ferric-dicitrate binding protein FerR (iron transport regulator)
MRIDEKQKEALQRKLIGEKLSATEAADLELWLQVPANKAFYDRYLQSGQFPQVVDQVLDLDESRLDRKMSEATKSVPRRHIRRIIAFTAAASIMLLVGGFLYWQARPTNTSKDQTARAREIPPATDKARLKLANGSIIYLDSTRNGKIATQGTVSITKTAGELAYLVPKESPAQQAGINELSVPRAGQFQLKLPDGTHVWLNSGTDIKYPVAFGSERRVSINGEAFLDVAKDPSKPFIVETEHTVTQVLGTTFNVNAYVEDSVAMITVLSGSVVVASLDKHLTLRPGEQAFQRQDRLSLEHPNVQVTTAWRRGFFNFQNANVQSIMKQISRFYDVTIRYEGQPSPETYDGLISRDLNLSQTVELLNKLNIKATLTNNRTIVVSPPTPQN